MSILYLVRHGQASVHGEDYDRLSPLGEEQSRALGRLWAERGWSFDRVFVGPRRRQRATCDAVARVYRRRGLDWPDAEPAPELDEHQAMQLVEHRRSQVLEEQAPAGEDGWSRDLRDFLARYRRDSRRWVQGELTTPPGVEPWPKFRARVASGLVRMSDGPGGQKVAAFTSGGAIAAAVGTALGLGEVAVLELSWQVRNAAWSELLFRPDPGTPARAGLRAGVRVALHTFNSFPHLDEPRLVTYI